MHSIKANVASHIIGDWFDTLTPGTKEHRDLDVALDQHAWLWESNRARRCERTRPLAVLNTVDRLRHWQEHSAAPQEARDAMGVLAAHLRERAGVVYDADLINEVDRLRAVLDSITANESVVIAKADLADGMRAALRAKATPLTADTDA